ncbi:(2Fe-2S)-binding protein [Rhodococcus rhodochrous]|uniref:2Fe-2S iron-sulfur cluster-binding protein n=1 Tax=Rhodococcus rhodochrous TaxID=1829 RepID=UPI001E541CDB|nr:2Fe-2S iron-sulfur cluster-binding protein [Rhodococcus rhodochrous]MCB8913918.1 (2Fe-2S)-binding protein [Rhodococcus rhodochrous]
MPKITFIHHDGGTVIVDATSGTTVMQSAMLADVPGIVAECGGSMMCATCHVYVHKDWTHKVGHRSEMEDEMLESTSEPCRPTSRLSCQITVTNELDGLTVETPRTQL